MDCIKFHKNRLSVDVIMTSFLFSKVISKGSYSAQSQGKKLCAKGNKYAAPDCDTSDSYLLVLCQSTAEMEIVGNDFQSALENIEITFIF